MVNKSKKVYVAMSGGVDSSVAAALLKEQGFNIIGVFFKPWQPQLLDIGCLTGCDWERERRDAMTVASVLGIPFKTWDFSKEYKKKVGDYMIETYRRGLTPNPDVMCNKEIKFGLFLKKALAKGADYIATGHYVRLCRKFSISNFQFPNKSKIQNPKPKKEIKLLKGKDKNKDQSYFLWTLTQKQLKYCLFPIGDYTKPEVRKIAKKFSLPTHNKKDSQGICFIGKFDMAEFLKNHIKPKTGEIRLLHGAHVIGKHEGVSYYTIGQRHGLNIGNGKGPYYVTAKDIKKNIIYVSGKNELGNMSQELKVKNANWVNKKPNLPVNIKVKIRYRNEEIPAKVLVQKGNMLEVKLEKPAKAIAPGQSAVFYKGKEVLGGGIIK